MIIASREAQQLAKGFSYSLDERESIAALLHPFHTARMEADRSGRRPEDIVVDRVERYARQAICDYIDAVPMEQRRRHYRKVSAAAAKLLRLINSGDLGEGSAGHYLVRFGMTEQSPPEYNFLPTFKAALQELTTTTGRFAASPNAPLPGYVDPFPGKHDPEKVEFAQRVLDAYVIEVNKKPGTSEDGPAARLLLAALDPALRFAQSIGIDGVRILKSGHNAKTLISSCKQSRKMGENLPKLF